MEKAVDDEGPADRTWTREKGSALGETVLKKKEKKRRGKEKEKKERDWEGVEVGDPQSGRRETCSMVCAIKQRALPTVSGSD